jgi:aminoglycoside phosphotransferase (APT) family kinase protein
MTQLVDPDHLSATWLEGVLRRQRVLTRGSVLSVVVEPLTAASFTGVFRRVTLRYDDEQADGPSSLIAKFSTPNRDLRATIHSMGLYGREVAFYTELAAATPVPVPTCYHAAVDEVDGRCVILLEDLTNAHRGRSTDRCSTATAEATLAAMARVHARWWQRRDLDSVPWLDPDTIMPAQTYQDQFVAAWPAFLDKLSIPITDQVRGFPEWAAQSLAAVLQRSFYSPPMTLIHHDLQADNLLLGDGHELPPVTIIDWQMVVRGRGPVDLAYLLSGSMDPDERRLSEHHLMDRYASCLAAEGVQGYGVADCVADYRAALLLPPTRLAIAVALSPQLTPHVGAFWDVLFDRQLRALADNHIDVEAPAFRSP